MLSVNTNAAALQAVQALASAGATLGAVQNRLSTGLKVASPKDDGATWAMAQSVRSDIQSRQAAGDSLNRASSILDTARGGAEQITELLSEIREKGSALADTTLDAPSQAAVRSDIASLIKQVDLIANGTEFGGVNLLAPVTDPSVQVAGPTGGPTPSLNVSATVDGKASLLQFDYQFYNTNPSPAPTASITGTDDDGTYWNGVPSADGQTIDESIVAQYGDWKNFDDQQPSTVTFSANTSPFPTPPAPVGYGVQLLGITQTPFRTHEYAVDTPDGGGGFGLTYRPMTAQWLGLSGLDTASSDTILSVTDAALAQATYNAGALGDEQKAAETESVQNAKAGDTLQAALGNMVDADLAKDSATLRAAQARQALSIQALGIANSLPRSLLQLFQA